MAIQPAARVQDILVVEDDEVLRELIALQLGNQGYKVRQAGTGNAALRQVADKPPDLILLDVNLPDLAGWEICARLKAEARTQVIPIIILTALDSTRDRWRGLEAGADDYLAKPFQPQELLIRVRSLLRMYHLYRSQIEAEQLRIRLEAQQDADRLKESFVAIVSHELRTPLTVLKGYLGLLGGLRGQPSSVKVLEGSLNDMSGALSQLESLIQELLDYSRLSAGVLTLRRRPLEFRELIRGVVSGLAWAADEKGVCVELDFPRREVRMRADPERLSQALHHLVENAIKFSRPGGRVVVGCRDRGSRILIRVQDEGVGIPPEELQRIFDPFYQASDYMTRKEGGVGLGLATTRHIVADHGGDIRARSRPGEGSTFLIRLPRSYSDAREVLTRLRRRTVEAGHSEGPLSTEGLEVEKE